jgi:hypothetical protein
VERLAAAVRDRDHCQARMTDDLVSRYRETTRPLAWGHDRTPTCHAAPKGIRDRVDPGAALVRHVRPSSHSVHAYQSPRTIPGHRRRRGRDLPLREAGLLARSHARRTLGEARATGDGGAGSSLNPSATTLDSSPQFLLFRHQRDAQADRLRRVARRRIVITIGVFALTVVWWVAIAGVAVLFRL